MNDGGTPRISLRDYFAAKAIAALIVNDHENQGCWDAQDEDDIDWSRHASEAYRVSDAMLAKRAKAPA